MLTFLNLKSLPSNLFVFAYKKRLSPRFLGFAQTRKVGEAMSGSEAFNVDFALEHKLSADFAEPKERHPPAFRTDPTYSRNVSTTVTPINPDLWGDGRDSGANFLYV